jgi:Cd2+/Zn2+-exporting ATPase
MSESISKKSVYRVQGFTCVNCAAKFEQNVIKALPKVQDAKVNFGASKITVYGEASVQELEQAGAFEGLKVYPEKEQRAIESEPFWKRKSTITTALSAIFLVAGWILGGEHPYSVAAFALSIVIGGYALFVKGLKSLVCFDFNMNTMTPMLGVHRVGGGD